MTTTLRRWPWWAFAAALLTVAAGCGQPPPMVAMSPPGVGGDPLAVEVDDEEFQAKAIGEAAAYTKADAEEGAAEEEVPVLEPTAPGEEAQADSGLSYATIEPGDPDAATARVRFSTKPSFCEGAARGIMAAALSAMH